MARIFLVGSFCVPSFLTTSKSTFIELTPVLRLLLELDHGVYWKLSAEKETRCQSLVRVASQGQGKPESMIESMTVADLSDVRGDEECLYLTDLHESLPFAQPWSASTPFPVHDLVAGGVEPEAL